MTTSLLEVEQWLDAAIREANHGPARPTLKLVEPAVPAVRWVDAAERNGEPANDKIGPTLARSPANPGYLEGRQDDHEESPRWAAGVVGPGGRVGGLTGPGSGVAPCGQRPGQPTTQATTHQATTAILHDHPDGLEDIPLSEAVCRASSPSSPQEPAGEAQEWDGSEVWFSVPAPALELELSDHALFVVGLLSVPKRLDKDGWRPPCRRVLDQRLGQQRVNGKQVERTTLLLGSRKRPDEGELIARGIVERYPVYDLGRAQEYRLRDRTWLDAKRCGVELCLRPSGRASAAVEEARADEQPVPTHLRRVYPEHIVLVDAAIRRIIDDARAHAPKRKRKHLDGLDLRDYDAIDAAIDSLDVIKNPELAGKKGRPPKGVCRDLRDRWRDALEHVWRNYVAATPHEHKLSRAHGRLFSPFVGLWSELRGCVRLRGEPLVELDIKNAQPLLIAARMVTEGYGDVPDVRHYIDLVQRGWIYEHAVNLLRGCALDAPVSAKDRTAMKVGFYSGWMFCELDTMDKADFGKAMTIAFPTVDKWVRDQKVDDYAAFACACQCYESTLMVDKLAVVFGREQLDVLTVHDASYVRVSQADRAVELLRNEVLASLPVRPIVNPKPVE